MIRRGICLIGGLALLGACSTSTSSGSSTATSATSVSSTTAPSTTSAASTTTGGPPTSAGPTSAPPATSAAPGSTAPPATTAPQATTAPPVTTAAPATVPLPAAADYPVTFVQAWSSGDEALLTRLGTAEAVSAVHAHDELRAGPWTQILCEGAAGSLFCTFTDPAGHELTVQLGNEAASTGQEHAVTGATFLIDPPTNAVDYSGQLVQAWVIGATSRVALLASTDAASTLAAHDADRAAGWQLPGQCEGAAGSSFCTFRAGSRRLVVQVGNEAVAGGQPHAATQVQFP